MTWILTAIETIAERFLQCSGHQLIFFRIKRCYVAFEAASEVNALTKASKLLNIFSKEKVTFRTIKKTLFIVPQVVNLCFSELSGAVLPSKLLLCFRKGIHLRKSNL